jgi:hypothetical protein
VFNPSAGKFAFAGFEGTTMLTLRKLNAVDADRLHRKLGRACREGERGVAERRYRMLCNVYLHLHKTLLRRQNVT